MRLLNGLSIKVQRNGTSKDKAGTSTTRPRRSGKAKHHRIVDLAVRPLITSDPSTRSHLPHAQRPQLGPPMSITQSKCMTRFGRGVVALARTHECKISIATRHLRLPLRHLITPVRSSSIRSPRAPSSLSDLISSVSLSPLLHSRIDNEFHSAAMRADPIHFRSPPPPPPPSPAAQRRSSLESRRARRGGGGDGHFLNGIAEAVAGRLRRRPRPAPVLTFLRHPTASVLHCYANCAIAADREAKVAYLSPLHDYIARSKTMVPMRRERIAGYSKEQWHCTGSCPRSR